MLFILASKFKAINASTFKLRHIYWFYVLPYQVNPCLQEKCQQAKEAILKIIVLKF